MATMKKVVELVKQNLINSTSRKDFVEWVFDQGPLRTGDDYEYNDCLLTADQIKQFRRMEPVLSDLNNIPDKYIKKIEDSFVRSVSLVATACGRGYAVSRQLTLKISYPPSNPAAIKPARITGWNEIYPLMESMYSGTDNFDDNALADLITMREKAKTKSLGWIPPVDSAESNAVYDLLADFLRSYDK